MPFVGNSSANKCDKTLIRARGFQHIKVEYVANILALTLSYPDKRQAIDRIIASERVCCLEIARQYREIWGVVLRFGGGVLLQIMPRGQVLGVVAEVYQVNY